MDTDGFEQIFTRFDALLHANLGASRYDHSRMVSKAAGELAARYGGDVEQARFAGLVHDIAKELPAAVQLQTIEKYSILLDDVERASPKLWHAIAGYALLKNEYGVDDEAVLDAVRWHTTARRGLQKLSRIVYLADCISQDRHFAGVDDIRAASDRSLAEGYLAMLEYSIRNLLARGSLLHLGTVEARNEQLWLLRHGDKPAGPKSGAQPPVPARG